MLLKRRRLLILLLAASQLACLSLGVLWAAKWLQGTFADFVQRSADAQSDVIVLDLARTLNEQALPAIDPGSAGWQRLQKICQRTSVPYDGFVSVVHRDTGALLADSRLHDDPRLLRKFPGRSILVTDELVAPLVQAARTAEAAPHAPATGDLEIAGQLYRATCLSLPELDAVLVAHMRQASLDESVAQLVTPVLQAGLFLTVAVVGASTLLTVLLVSKFDMTLSTLGASVEREVDHRTLTLTRSRSALVLGLARLAESRDKDAGHHLERMRTYVTILATELAKQNPEIDHHYVANLAAAAALHDVGKIGVPDSVILKLGRLTAAERRAMQMHTVLGGECLAGVAQNLSEPDQFVELARQIAVGHHEQWDGSGYPHGLQGRAIPLAARIVALADVYDALTTRRTYRDAVSHAEAREWIVSNYGSQFDPEVVEAFIEREQDFAKVSAAAASERRTAATVVRAPAAQPAAAAGEATPDDAASEPADAVRES